MPKTFEEKIRKKKFLELLKEGFDSYPAKIERTHTCEEILARFEGFAKNNKMVSLVGRLRSIRVHGGSSFAHLEDGTGRIQIYFKKDLVGKDNYDFFKDKIDLGDFLECQGRLFKTKTREKTLRVEKFKLICKSFRPLPEKWHGLADIEIRYRKRYLDLIANPGVRGIFKKRSLILKYLREFLDKQGFIEVETPILQPLPGGANAKPFKTHHEALNLDLYLRIAPELYLKRLIVGGFEKVYEIGRCFRNEGIDWTHNPDFTMLEFYQAYIDYKELMKLTEGLINYVVEKTEGQRIIEYERKKIDFIPPFPRITFRDAILKFTKINIDKVKNEKELAAEIKKLGIKIDKKWSYSKILDELYKEKVRPQFIQPTFLIDYPVELSPLAKRIPGANYAERFQLIAGGVELTNCFSELNNPEEQKERFKQQERLRKRGEEEAQRIDYDFLEALEYGMPPCGGFGLGVDRLVALLTNSHSLRQVILFPTMRPKKGSS